jgi:hypothetical protein
VKQLEAHVGGPLVVAPIGRDIVLFTSTTSKPGLDALRLLLLAEKQMPAAIYPITTRAYRFTPEGWTTLRAARALVIRLSRSPAQPASAALDSASAIEQA